MLVHVLVLALVDGVPSDQALMSSRMSETETSFGSVVDECASGTLIVSDLRAVDGDVGGIECLWDSDLWDVVGAKGGGRVRGEGGVVGLAEARSVRRGGRVRYCESSCGFGVDFGGTAGRGLLTRLRADGLSVPEMASRGIKRESGRVGVFEGARGEETETTWANSREYHNTSSSSSSSSYPSCVPFPSASCPGSGENGAMVNSKVSSELSSEAKRDAGDLTITRRCFEMRGRSTLSEGERWLGHSSSEVPGVVGISVLEQADMLVRDGVGERDRGGDRCLRSRERGGVLGGTAGFSVAGEAGSDAEMSMIISNALKRTV